MGSTTDNRQPDWQQTDLTDQIDQMTGLRQFERNILINFVRLAYSRGVFDGFADAQHVALDTFKRRSDESRQ